RLDAVRALAAAVGPRHRRWRAHGGPQRRAGDRRRKTARLAQSRPAMPLTHRSRAAFAVEGARSAGALANRYFHGEIAFAIEQKDGPQDFVSVADRAVEAHIRTALASAFPDDSMLGEEGGGKVGNSVWVVDPIDGTLNFVHGVRYWCVSLCYIEDGVRTV